MGVNILASEHDRARLAALRVGIAGAGGLGSNCAMHLVRSGVGHLVVADFDVVSDSNLNRQFFFKDQIGRAKVDALKENLRRIDPELDIEVHKIRVSKDNFAGIFGRCDILVEAFDNADAKRMFLSAANSLGRPMVSASGIAGWGRSSSVRISKLGKRLFAIGDGETAASVETPPFSPRVGIAAAMEANTVCALALALEP